MSQVTTFVMKHVDVVDMSMSDTDIETIVASIYEAKVVNVWVYVLILPFLKFIS